MRSRPWSCRVYENPARFLQIEGAHPLGTMGVSWAPAVPRGSLTSGKAPGPPVRRFASGGCDNTVKVGRKCTTHHQDGLENHAVC